MEDGEFFMPDPNRRDQEQRDKNMGDALYTFDTVSADWPLSGPWPVFWILVVGVIALAALSIYA